MILIDKKSQDNKHKISMDRTRPINITRRSVQTLVIGVILGAAFLIFSTVEPGRTKTIAHLNSCHFPAIFNFGDSNSDTGAVSAAFNRAPPPNGKTFFGRPSGRYCDGRLIIDFIAESLGLPYLSAYLDSMGTNFKHGANFAASGTTIKPLDCRTFESGFNPLTLDVQLSQFEQFKERTTELYNQGLPIKSSLPKPVDFSKALYTLDIGQNDIHAGIELFTEEQLHAAIPNITNHLGLAIEHLYKQGARAFWIHNTGPIGCLPYLVIRDSPKHANVDQNGCVKSFNEVAQGFNSLLKDRVSQLRTQLNDALLIYVDIYSAKYSLISNAKKYGYVNPLGYCCGDDHIEGTCWTRVAANGSVIGATSCSNPGEYISWDSIHHTEAANRWIVGRILDGSFSDPPVPVTKACHNSQRQHSRFVSSNI